MPEGYNSLTPYLSVVDAGKAIEFYEKAFGAKETGRITMPDGTIGHAELQIGDSKLLLAEESKAWGNLCPQTLGGSPVTLTLYVEDVDRVFDRALKEGAKVTGDIKAQRPNQNHLILGNQYSSFISTPSSASSAKPNGNFSKIGRPLIDY